MTAPELDGPGPRATEPLATTSGRSATWLAERALLGALLRRPERLVEVSTWLSAVDYADPVHRTVYETLHGLYRAGQLRGVT